MDTILRTIKRFIPRKIFKALQPLYHYVLALTGALMYRFPSRHIILVAVTGTKGKTTTTELVNVILEKAGHKTALASTLRFKIGDTSNRNLYKMTMPGRFFLQRFLRQAVTAGCQYAVIEMTSEGAKQFRHKFLALDALLFTNLSPEHIESHGSYEKYKTAKLSIAKALASSSKPHTVMIANGDDKEAVAFLSVGASENISVKLSDVTPYETHDKISSFTWRGVKTTLALPGIFNITNAILAARFAETQSISDEVIRSALSNFSGVRGRMEFIQEGQPFEVIVDYAHTTDSLKNAYGALTPKRRICVLGGTGGGRDTWKRKEMGAIASQYCSRIILTDEDPYDENPDQIVSQIAEGIPKEKYEIVMDRRKAIAKAFSFAEKGDAVFITGKGTDPYIMGPKGSKTPWDDATVAREELKIVH
jgi:UDP-N-acetylmuramoyl-L-alanyl-D-glutamate--2,6-diaminopimelate ligase